MDLQTIAVAFGPLATVLGVVIPLVIHLDKKTDKKIEAMALEMKDFHEKLINIEKERILEKIK